MLNEKISTLGIKETFKYLEILEADTIKKVKMKEKISQMNKRTSGNEALQQESYQKKADNLGYPPF